MFLACLRGLLPKGTPLHPWRSNIRTELVLAHLANELEAEFLQNLTMLHAAAMPALSGSPDKLSEVLSGLHDQLLDSAAMREMEKPSTIKTNSRGAITVDRAGLFKLYEAMMDVGFIKRAP